MRPRLAAQPNCQSRHHDQEDYSGSRNASRPTSPYSTTTRKKGDLVSAVDSTRIAMKSHRRPRAHVRAHAHAHARIATPAISTAAARASLVLEGSEAPSTCSARPRPKSNQRTHHSPSLTTPSTIFMTLLIVFLSVAPVAAVQIGFQNCLSDSYRLSKPSRLQLTPEFAEAVFDTKGQNHNLQITIWGNVSGSQTGDPLPPPNDPYWNDPTQTNGKIVEVPDPAANIATTLLRKVEVLTYQPFREKVDFCNNTLHNGQCPLGPRFGNVEIPSGLPSFNLSHDFFSSYAFTSFATTFIIVSGDTNPITYGCISTVVTPDLGNLKWVLKFLPLLILLIAGFAVPFAGIFSPWGTTDIFNWSSNYGRDADLLRLVTPGFGDCLQYIQFIVLSGALTLDYPGFFQPIVSQVGWSALMFNESLVSNAPGYHSVVDGIYVTNATYGLERQGQLVGMAEGEDIWPGMMVWLCVVILSVIVLIQAAFAVQWIHRKIRKIPEEDLRAKNLPFVIGNVVRIVFNYMIVPIVAFSAFQLVIASKSHAYAVALAAVTLFLMIGFASWLLYLVIGTRPKSVLFDDLPTVLRYGPLYNTYSDDVASFALIPLLLNFIRGIAIGAVQPSGVAQVVLLAICEVIQILMIYAFRPYQSATSMNIYHGVFAFLRLVIIMLMISFAPSLGVTEGPKGWIAYVILLIHAFVLVLGFFLGALQTIIEVAARMLGAGGDDIGGLRRGGLSKIFGMRQLARRVNHRQAQSRASHLSTTAMLDADDVSKSGYTMPSGRVRSSSAASLGGVMAHHRHRSSSAIDSIDMYSAVHRNMDSASSYAPGTPGEASNFSFLTSPVAARQGPLGPALEASDPYYRPPRQRRETLGDSTLAGTQRGSIATDSKPVSRVGITADAMDASSEVPQGTTAVPPTVANLQMSFPASRPDYSTREVDFYYGVRGPALNSVGLGRKLGTGPADPTGPVATATGWFRGLLGGKTKEKGKGFEVVRSSRMPPNMARGPFGEDSPPEGIPVAMGVLRNGPIDSDDDDEPAPPPRARHREGDLLNDEGEPQSDPEDPGSPVIERLPRGRISRNTKAHMEAKALDEGQRHEAEDDDDDDDDEDEEDGDGSTIENYVDAPEIPRKSSKRHSAVIEHGHNAALSVLESERPESQASQQTEDRSIEGNNGGLLPRLPFDRRGSDRRPSSKSSLVFPDNLANIDLGIGDNGRPLSYGTVPHHGISRFDLEDGGAALVESSAELVDERAVPKRS